MPTPALDNSLLLDNGLLLGTVSQVNNVAHGPIVFATLFVLFCFSEVGQ